MRKSSLIFSLLFNFFLLACAKKPEFVVPTPAATIVLSSPCNAFSWPVSVSEIPGGYAAIGKQLYNSQGCETCHGTMSDINTAAIGPSLIGFSERWSEPAQHLYDSILYPNDIISPDCPTGPCLGPPSTMRQDYRYALSCDEMADLLAYLLESPTPSVRRTPTPDLPYYSDIYQVHSFAKYSVNRPSPNDLLADWPIHVEDLPRGNAQQGEAWFSKIGVGCTVCHNQLDDDSSNSRGPNLAYIPFQEGDGMTLKQYLYESILYPDAFDISGNDFAEPMPNNFGERLSQQQVADLISFMMKYQR